MSSVRSTSDGRGPVTRKRVPDREEPGKPRCAETEPEQSSRAAGWCGSNIRAWKERKRLSLLRLHNGFIPIKQLHLFGRSKSVRFYLKRFRPFVTRSNLRDSISRDLAYISLHLLDANPKTHEHWVFATLSRHTVSHLSSEVKPASCSVNRR